jgi:phage replication initiation protein
LACTFLDGDTIEDIALELGTRLEDSGKWRTGAQGYTDVWTVYGGWIGVNPDRPDMGVHLVLSGRALDQFRLETKKSDVDIILWFVGLGARFTRIDVAFDVYTKDVLDMEWLETSVKSGLCVSRWKTAKAYATYQLRDGQPVGGVACGGFTFGSRTSNAYLRVYDKRQERLSKTGECDKTHWIRLEMEYKKENAQAIVKLIQDDRSLNWLGANLRYYLDIKEGGQTDKNRSRWATAEWWVRLTSEIKTRLPVVKKVVQDVILSTKNWIKKQVAPSIAFIVQCDFGDVGWLYEVMGDGKARMSARHKRVLKEIEQGA